MTTDKLDRLTLLALSFDELNDIERACSIEPTQGPCPCPPNWHRDGWRSHQFPLNR